VENRLNVKLMLHTVPRRRLNLEEDLCLGKTLLFASCRIHEYIELHLTSKKITKKNNNIIINNLHVYFARYKITNEKDFHCVSTHYIRDTY